jgi:hypothetical protein
MKPEFGPNPFQYLMIFLRDPPEDGIDGFQRHIINNASYSTEGSSDQHLFYDWIGEETRVKVLVTGEIELNEKNVFIGLKMAFPEWDFQRYPLHIQKLFIKESDEAKAKEAGVIATTNRSRNSGTHHWGLPCVLNLAPTQHVQFTSPGKSTGLPSLFEHVSSWISKDNEDLDIPDHSLRKENHDEDSLKGFDEIDLKGILDLTEETPTKEMNQESLLNSSEQSIFRKVSLPEKLDETEEFFAGEDSKDILKRFREENKTSPFTSLGKEDDFDFTFLDEASTFSPLMEETESRENSFSTDRFGAEPFIEEEEDIAPEFLEAGVGFKYEGMIEEDFEDNDSSQWMDDDLEKDPGFHLLQLPIINKLQSALISRIKALPLRKIASISLATGLTIFLLSFGVKAIEPNYENTRKSAGVVDLYDWIILNDMVGPDTDSDALMDLWQDSSEYRQFWFWFDTEWTPRITVFRKIESGLRTAGGILLSPAIIILLVAVLDRTASFKKKSQVMGSEPRNRISLDFATYNNDWGVVESWAKETGFKILEIAGDQRLYRRKGSISHPPTLCLVGITDNQVQLEAWVGTRLPAFLIPLLSDMGLEVLEAKSGVLPASTKDAVNKLLLKLGHPPLA